MTSFKVGHGMREELTHTRRGCWKKDGEVEEYRRHCRETDYPDIDDPTEDVGEAERTGLREVLYASLSIDDESIGHEKRQKL